VGTCKKLLTVDPPLAHPSGIMFKLRIEVSIVEAVNKVGIKREREKPDYFTQKSLRTLEIFKAINS
jgi:hypothetical protein